MKKINTRLLVTNDGIPMRDACLIVDRNGRVMEICSRLQDADVEAEVIVPGFVNAHTHLELSHLRGIVPSDASGMTAFIQEMIRQRSRVDEAAQFEAMLKADEEMVDEGIVAVGDISNTLASAAIKSKSKIYYHTFVELSGLDPAKAAEITTRGIKMVRTFREEFNLPASLSPHAPYSVSSALMSSLLAALYYDDPLTIHVQESDDELQFCNSKSGPLYDFFLSAGFRLDDVLVSGSWPLLRLLQLLPRSNRCQLVHNTFTSEDEILASLQTHPQLFWCLCVHANLFITGCHPPADLLFRHHATVTIGTDSLASNHRLSIVHELAAIHAAWPQLPFAELVKWSSLNGAKLLGIDHLCGSIRTGMKPGILRLKGVSADNPLFNENVSVERLC